MFFWIIPIHLTKWIERNKRKSGDLGSDALSGVALSFVCHSLKRLALRLQRPTMGHDGKKKAVSAGLAPFRLWQTHVAVETHLSSWRWGFHGQARHFPGVPCDLDDLVPPGHTCS